MFDESEESKFFRYAAIAVLAAGAIWVAAYLITDARNRADIAAAERVFGELGREIAENERQQRMINAQARADAEARERSRQAHAIEEARERREAAQERQREARKFENEWRAHYKPPAECVRPGDDWQKQVECGNHYMRARREFEENYKRR